MESVEFRLATAGDLESLVALRAEFLAELTGCDPGDPTLLTAMSRYFSATIPTGDFIAYLAVAALHFGEASVTFQACPEFCP
jgi:hypothetical protein